MSIGELHIIEERVKPLFKIILWFLVSIILWMISWKEHFHLIVHFQNMLLLSIVLFFDALLKIFIILGKHLTIGKNILMWMKMYNLTLVSPQLHLVKNAKGCKKKIVPFSFLYIYLYLIYYIFHDYGSIINMLLFLVDMSSKGTSKHTRKHNMSRASRDRSNESHHLRHQQNKDIINEHWRDTYHTRMSETTLQNYFMISCKYHTMDDIMERIFPLDSSFPESPHCPHNFVFSMLSS